MTTSRSKIAESLAARGRPVMWANEQETAALLGLPSDSFRAKLRELEVAGLPQRAALNGKRFIPHIERFIALQAELPKPVDNSNHPDFHTRIEHLPHEVQSRLCTCFGTNEEIAAKRQHARLVCRFGNWNGRPAVQYRYAEEPIRAATLQDSVWSEMAVTEFAISAKTMTFERFVAEFGTLPDLPDWLFQRVSRRVRKPR